MPKSAFVAIAGRPSAGKSTLVNALCGEKVSIVSPVPQTTRNTLRGIVNRPEGQLVLLDTPGYHISEKKLNLRLRGVSDEAFSDADIILYLVDATREPGPEEDAVAAALANSAERLVAAINKVDSPEAVVEGARLFISSKFPKATILEIRPSRERVSTAFSRHSSSAPKKARPGIPKNTIPIKSRSFASPRSFGKRFFYICATNCRTRSTFRTKIRLAAPATLLRRYTTSSSNAIPKKGS